MSLGDVASAVALVVSVIALARGVHRDRTCHIDAVSLFYSWAFVELTETHHPEIIVRNDGEAAVTVSALGMAYGNWYIVDRNKPERWAHVAENAEWLLPPGGERRVLAPEDPPEVCIIGPLVFVTDANGRRWQRSTTHRAEVAGRARPPRRREIWVERRRWWPTVDEKLASIAMRRLAQRPGRIPMLATLIDLVWGWRVGPVSMELLPLNAPRGWRYAESAQWTSPEVASHTDDETPESQ